MTVLSHGRRFALACGALLLCAGCMLTPTSETRTGEMAARMVEEQMGLVKDPKIVDYVRSIGERLAKHSPRQDVQYRFYVVDMAEPNAFALPGGFIYVSRGLLPLAQRMLPSLDPVERSAWLGFRPSMPDSLPVIGAAPRHRDVFLAFGHGHLGMGQGPVTGRVIADLAAGRDPGFDLSPFRPDRP